jgi:hypothetical protein
VAEGGGPLATLTVGLVRQPAGGWQLHARVAHGAAPGFQENAAFLFAGWGAGAQTGRWFAAAGLALGAGLVWQAREDPADKVSAWSPAAAAAGQARAGVFLTDRLALTVEGWLPAALLRREGATRVVPMPAAALGLALALP